MEDSFVAREHQFEAKFAHDEALKFRVVAHRDKLFAAWIADQMGNSAPPNYAEAFAAFALGRTPVELIAKAAHDLHDHGVALAEIRLRKAFEHLQDQSEVEVLAA